MYAIRICYDCRVLEMVATVFEIIMWKRPVLTVLILGCGTLVWYNCGPLQRSAVALACDVLLVLACSLALLGLLSRQLHLSLPLHPMEWQVSQDRANKFAACVANAVGAAEGVLRVAASGRDCKHFGKVVLLLYLISAVGRAASGATVAYVALWVVLVVTFCASKLAPEVAAQTPVFLQKRWEERKQRFAGVSGGDSSPSSYNSTPSAQY